MSGRIRSIKPEVLDDEVAASLSDAAWRLWVSSWVLADDYGNFRLGERYLAAQVWQDTSRDVAEPVAELVIKRRLDPYAVAGQPYAHIHAWEKHQRIDNAGKRGRVPPQQEDEGTWLQLVSARLAAILGESPRFAESLGGSPLRARAPSPTPTPTPTTDQFLAAAAAEGGDGLLTLDRTDPEASKETKARRRGQRLPESWIPSEATVAWCQSQGADPMAMLGAFHDYWRGIPGQKGVKLDWDATFRNRVRDLVDAGRAPRWIAPRPQLTLSPPAKPVDPVRPEDIDEALAGFDDEFIPGYQAGGQR